MAMLRQAKPLELYTESNRAIIMDGSEVAPFLEMPFLAEPQGTIVLAEADLPLITRQSRGFGLLTYFDADLTGAPLADWHDRGQFVIKLLDWGEAKSKGTTFRPKAMAFCFLPIKRIPGSIFTALRSWRRWCSIRH